MNLKGKTALLFGAGAIASGYATSFAEEDTNLAIVSRGESAHRLVREISHLGSGTIEAINADASVYDEIDQVYKKTIEKFGRIDIVINGSGGASPDSTALDLEGILQITPQAAGKTTDNNYLAKWYSMQRFLKHLHSSSHKGSVVNITSMAGLTPLSRSILYSAAFAAVENLTKSMAFVYGHYGYGRVNNVAVGFIVGKQNYSLLYDEQDNLTQRGSEITMNTSQHRFLKPEDIAHQVLYLSDEEKTGAINGITFRVDGGYGLIDLAQTGYE